jgi:thiol:disulfide interchange protein
MKKQLLISLALAFGIGIAQAQNQSSPAPMQSGTEQRGNPQPPVSTGPASANAPGMPNTSEATAPQSFKGCLNGSPGNWSLTSDDGKNLTLNGTDDQLSSHQGQQVRIEGTQANDGSVKVASIEKISASCANQQSSNTGEQNSSTNQNISNNQTSTSTTSSTTQSTTSSQPPSSASETTAQSSSSSQPGASATTPETSGAVSGQSSSTAGNTTPPVTDQTPANSVGTGTEQSAAQNPPAGNAAGNTGQNSTSADQNANQGVKHFSDMDQNSQKLPQTASPLPLLGLLGLGSLAGGLIARRKK